MEILCVRSLDPEEIEQTPGRNNAILNNGTAEKASPPDPIMFTVCKAVYKTLSTSNLHAKNRNYAQQVQLSIFSMVSQNISLKEHILVKQKIALRRHIISQRIIFIPAGQMAGE